MPRIRIVIASAICVGFADLLNAQNSALPANPVVLPLTTSADLPSLRVGVLRVSESRSSQGLGSTNLELTVVGEGLPQEAMVRQVIVTKAVDNNDRPLAGGPGGGRGGASMSPMAMMSRMSNPGAMAQPLQARATIGIAPRTADFIKFVEGTIEVFVPAESTGSIIRIANIKSHFGRVENPTLTKHGIVFHFLGDKESEDEAAALMSGGGGTSSVRVDSITGYGYFFRDPSGKLAGVQLQDGKGVPLPSSGGGGGGGPNGSLMRVSLRSPITDDTQLLIYVAVPEAIKTVPFRVEDIALP